MSMYICIVANALGRYIEHVSSNNDYEESYTKSLRTLHERIVNDETDEYEWENVLADHEARKYVYDAMMYWEKQGFEGVESIMKRGIMRSMIGELR